MGTRENDDKVMCVKNPTTFKEQLEILEARGLYIKDREKAIETLKNVNYYRLSAYTLSLKKNDEFFKNVTFDTIRDLYTFDKRLRILLLDLIETIEIAFRTHITYLIAHHYGPLGYLDENNFRNAEYHQGFKEELARELNKSREIFVVHHQKKYGGQIPIWAVIEVASFGMISKLYANMKADDKKKIALEYYNTSAHVYIESWLRTIAFIRNVCAHYGRLYNKKLIIKPKLYREDKEKNILQDSLFATVWIMKKLITDENQWKSFVVSLSALIEEYAVVDLKLLGFPINWLELLES